jgi:replicative DNA helicase
LIETKIISHLLFNEEYSRKILPFIKEEYFQQSKPLQTVFKLVQDYYTQYNKPPTKEALYIDLTKIKHPSETAQKECQTVINNLEADHNTSIDWLIDKTEEFCKRQALHNAILESIHIFDKKSEHQEHAIPEILKEALAVSFDTNVGHDFIEDAAIRHDFYTQQETHIPFDITLLNDITEGGLIKKTLNVAMAPPGVGKSMLMCHCAAANLVKGFNVLYITLEMSEKKIAERIDANLLDMTVKDLKTSKKKDFLGQIEKLKKMVASGKIIVKEYPTASAGPAHFRHLVNELRLKKNFFPDIIYVDYINLCVSSRMKASVGSYAYITAIAQELRGLASELDLPIFTATQVNRAGMNSIDVDMTNISESVGLTHTADLLFALISDENLEKMDQLMIKQLKNRYADMNNPRRFVVGINRAKMRMYDIDQPMEEDVVFDNTDASNLEKKFSKKSKNNFEEFV